MVGIVERVFLTSRSGSYFDVPDDHTKEMAIEDYWESSSTGRPWQVD